MTQLENNTDKARIKFETALTLSKKYRAIIDKMKGVSTAYLWLCKCSNVLIE